MHSLLKILVVSAFASALIAIGLYYYASTSVDRARQRATSELEQLGAYFVGFDGDTVVPDSSYFMNVKSLYGIERYSSLTHLDFTDSNVSNGDLSDLILLPNVFYLELDGTMVSDDGIATLARIPNLNVLDVTGTQITDASVPNLAKIAGLQGVAAKETQLTQPGVQQLLKLRPDIWVKHESVDLDELDAAMYTAERPLGNTIMPDDEP